MDKTRICGSVLLIILTSLVLIFGVWGILYTWYLFHSNQTDFVGLTLCQFVYCVITASCIFVIRINIDEIKKIRRENEIH